MRNEKPLEHHLDAQSDINYASFWFDEGETTLDYENLLQTVPNSHPKNMAILNVFEPLIQLALVIIE